VIKEALIGVMIGGLLRMFLSSLAVAGEAIALQTTLSFSQTANPLQAQPGTSITAFLSLLGITLVFATNLHHLFIGAVANSYQAVPAPAAPCRCRTPRTWPSARSARRFRWAYSSPRR
jgi:flagellar biosynthetic protein FliR